MTNLLVIPTRTRVFTSTNIDEFGQNVGNFRTIIRNNATRRGRLERKIHEIEKLKIKLQRKIVLLESQHFLREKVEIFRISTTKKLCSLMALRVLGITHVRFWNRI